MFLFFPGTVKKCGLFKILHEKYKQTGKSKSAPEIAEFRHSLEEAAELYPEITPHLPRAQVYVCGGYIMEDSII